MSALQPIRRFLLEPRTFFEEYGTAATLPAAAVTVLVLAIAFAVGVSVVGGLLAGAVQGTVTVDNPDRPPEEICEAFGSDSSATNGCEEPETIERDAGAIVSAAADEYIGPALFSPFLLWLAGGVTLYLGGLLVGGDTSLSGSFAVAGWAAVPEFFRLAVGLGALRVALADVTIQSVDAAPEAVRTALAPVEPFVAVATVLTAAWQLFVLSAGLSVEAEISRGAAAVVTGVPLALLVFATLA